MTVRPENRRGKFCLRLFLMALTVGATTFLNSCATTDQTSSVPWNRPQPWERQGGGATAPY
jgi:hypothetical protein